MGAVVHHEPNLIIPSSIWRETLTELHRRTGEHHESGAFLLGRINEHERRVEQVVFYDDLDPHAYRTGVVVLHAASFGPLWDLCRSNRSSVIADIHVHPEHAYQSLADRENPMIAMPGHLALIVPWYARPPVLLEELGFFEYRGRHRWRTLGGPYVTRFLHIEPLR